MQTVIETINGIIWGIPVLLLILVTGIILTYKTKGAQIRLFPAAVRHFLSSFQRRNGDGNSGYRALCTALAATVGTGNIAGVAGAIAIGGPGVIFWMWVCALLGMIIKFAEVTLALYYRKKDSAGHYTGGAMYMIRHGLSGKLNFLAVLFCVFGIAATFGTGNAAQINAVTDGAKQIASLLGVWLGRPAILVMGVVLSCLITAAFRNGSSGIGRWAEILVPFASVIYIILAILVLILRFREIPFALQTIFYGAFSPKAVTGGVIGSFLVTLRTGVSRGIFTNEAGMGTASIAHATANEPDPIKQGYMGIIEVFLDTVVLCSLTALVILCSGTQVSYGTDTGILLTMKAFAGVLGNWVQVVISALVCIFAFATILGWGLYGMTCAQYLFGKKISSYFLFSEAVVVIIASVTDTAIIWTLSEIFNGLMAIPNLVAVMILMPVFLKQIKCVQTL